MYMLGDLIGQIFAIRGTFTLGGFLNYGCRPWFLPPIMYILIKMGLVIFWGIFPSNSTSVHFLLFFSAEFSGNFKGKSAKMYKKSTPKASF
jgi:hypothetical protein